MAVSLLKEGGCKYSSYAIGLLQIVNIKHVHSYTAEVANQVE